VTTTGDAGRPELSPVGLAGPSGLRSHPSPMTGVVVVNYGASHLLASSLSVLSDVAGLRIVVVDARHSIVERRSVTAMAADHGWTLVGLPDNPGFGAAVNAGVARAREDGAEYIVLLNPDATVALPDLEALVATVREQPDALVTPLIEDADGNTWFAGGELLLRDGITRTRGVVVEDAQHPWATGACLAFAASLWDRVGGFDERYFMYWEDIDLSARVLADGGRVVVRRDLLATHQVGGTQEGRGKSDLYCRYNCRNRLLFAAIHLSDRQLRGWLRSAPRYAGKVLRRGGWRALLRRPVGPVVATLRGTLEGIGLVVSLRGVRAVVPFLSPAPRQGRAA
jgi:N-acetylglucosaminyl-diphospho-decaprenol L-rhamnosyltransferase